MCRAVLLHLVIHASRINICVKSHPEIDSTAMKALRRQFSTVIAWCVSRPLVCAWACLGGACNITQLAGAPSQAHGTVAALPPPPAARPSY